DDGVEDQGPEVVVTPVLVEVAAGEADPSTSVGPLDRPAEDLVASLGIGDVLVRTSGGRALALASLVARLGDEDRGDPLHLGAEPHVVVPLVVDGEWLDPSGDR